MESYLPELEKLIKISLARVEKIKSVKEPNFENVSLALESCNYEIEFLLVSFLILMLRKQAKEQEIAKEMSTALTTFDNDLNLDSVLFEKLKMVYNKRSELDLCEESQRLLEKQQ